MLRTGDFKRLGVTRRTWICLRKTIPCVCVCVFVRVRVCVLREEQKKKCIAMINREQKRLLCLPSLFVQS